MSSLWLNLRVWYWHLKIGPDWPWVRIHFNVYRWDQSLRSPWIELH